MGCGWIRIESMSTLLILALALVPQSGEADLIDNAESEIRLRAVELAGLRKNAQAIPRLIARLESKEEKPAIQAAALKALEMITGRRDKDAAAWRSWWTAEGSAQFLESSAGSDAKLTARQEELIRVAKQDIRAITTVLAVSIFLFIIVMFFFVGHVSSKIKGWRELVARAEVYIKHGQELTERTDKIAAELESKKAEMASFVEKIRREQEEVITRRGDEMGSQLMHDLRMELQTLRQKAERELDQTVTDLKTQIESTARRAAADVRDRLTK
jgi:CHASE3 domain sensor protein